MGKITTPASLARVVGASMLAIVALAAAPARADFQLDLGTVFNGDTPTSTPPYLIMDFKDTAPNTVTLTLTGSLETASEFIDQVTFNVNPAFTPSAVTVLQLTGPTATSIDHTTDNAQNLTGGGAKGRGFDFAIHFTTANDANRFKGFDVSTFSFTAAGLDAAAFDSLSSPPAPNTGLLAAAHVQGIPLPGGGTTSGAVTVPEPASISLLGLGLAGLALKYRRRRAD